MATLNQLQMRLDMLENRVPGMARRSVGHDAFWTAFELYTDNILIDAAGHRDYVRSRLDAMRTVASTHLVAGASALQCIEAEVPDVLEALTR